MSKEADRLIAWLGEVHALPPFDVSGLVRDVEAAAEERGRRRGVEEAQRLVYAVMAEWPGSYDGLNCVLQRLKSLAPRDSAPGGDCQIVGCQIIGKHEHPIGGPSEARK